MTSKDIKKLLEKDDIAYRAGEKTMPKWQYDRLVAQLKAEGEYLELNDTKYADISLQHVDKMYSLEDVFSLAELNSKLVASITSYYATAKADGIACEVIYTKGKFTELVARGDGVVGDSMFHNKDYTNIPLTLPTQDSFALYGELVMKFKDFEDLNKRLKKPYENPRNTVAGTMRLKKSVNDGRIITFIPYGTSLNQSFEELKTFLLKLNFEFEAFQFNSISKETINKLAAFTKKLKYPTDGIVFKLKSYQEYIKAGFRKSSPKGAVAYKFEELRKPTILLGFKFTVGATGKITPVAEVKPVKISGSTVKRASVYNYKSFIHLHINIGDRVFVVKKAEIIPKIVSVEKLVEGELAFPTHCPTCLTELEEKERDMFCPNTLCEARALRKFLRLVDKKAFNIEMGEATVEKLIEKGLHSPGQIFQLTLDQIITLEGFAELSAHKLKQSILHSKTIKLENFIFALHIPHIAFTTSKYLAKTFKTLHNILTLTYEDLIELKDIGDVTATAYVEFMHSSYMENLLEEFLSADVEILDYVEANGLLSGLIICLTGTFELGKDTLTIELERLGAEVTDSLTKYNNLLLIGKNPGKTKLTKAKKDGIKSEIYTNDWLVAKK